MMGLPFLAPEQHVPCMDDPETFWHSDKKQHAITTARLICRTCHTRTDCLEYAIEHRDVSGVWGGKTEAEREDIRKARGLALRAERRRGAAAAEAARIAALLRGGGDIELIARNLDTNARHLGRRLNRWGWAWNGQPLQQRAEVAS